RRRNKFTGWLGDGNGSLASDQSASARAFKISLLCSAEIGSCFGLFLAGALRSMKVGAGPRYFRINMVAVSKRSFTSLDFRLFSGAPRSLTHFQVKSRSFTKLRFSSLRMKLSNPDS